MYADPGSGLLLVQAVSSMLVGGIVVCRRRIMSFFGKQQEPSVEVAQTEMSSTGD